MELPGVETESSPRKGPRVVINRSALTVDIRKLSSLSSAKTIAATLREWFLITATVATALWLENLALTTIAVAFIATRQHALLILMHEGAHMRLFASGVLNDVMSDILLAMPLNISTRRYRHLHGMHHLNTNHPEADPDRKNWADDDQWNFPRPSRYSALVVALRDLFCINLPRTLKAFGLYSPWTSLVERLVQGDSAKTGITNREVLCLILVQALTVGFLAWTNGWSAYIVFWVAPTATVLPLLLRIRGVAEHHGVPGGDEVRETRHVAAGPVEAFLISPFHINYHAAHHMVPSVPWYNLPELHSRLMQNPQYASRLVVSPSYMGPGGVFDELTQPLKTS